MFVGTMDVGKGLQVQILKYTFKGEVIQIREHGLLLFKSRYRQNERKGDKEG
jgi:hypothetical protein